MTTVIFNWHVVSDKYCDTCCFTDNARDRNNTVGIGSNADHVVFSSFCSRLDIGKHTMKYVYEIHLIAREKLPSGFTAR